MKLNEDQLPIKYILGIHKQMPEYPSGIDILYHLVKMHVRKPTRYKQTFTFYNLTTYEFPNESEADLRQAINELIKLGYIDKLKSKKESYKIIKNPFE